MRYGRYPLGIYAFTWVRVGFAAMKFSVYEVVF